MSKKYRDKTCVYCGRPGASAAGEHVFSRQFFPPDLRHDLPKVPTCEDCNTQKSGYEDYVLSTVAMGTLAPAAIGHHLSKLPRRLASNHRLHSELLAASSPIWLRAESGLVEPRIAVPIDSDRYDPLFKMIARGLIWHHWSVLLAQDAEISVHLPYPRAQHIFTESNFDKYHWRYVNRSLGGGSIDYAGWQSTEEPQCTFWRIILLGGVVMGSPGAQETSSLIGVFTAPAEYERRRLEVRSGA